MSLSHSVTQDKAGSQKSEDILEWFSWSLLLHPLFPATFTDNSLHIYSLREGNTLQEIISITHWWAVHVINANQKYMSKMPPSVFVKADLAETDEI